MPLVRVPPTERPLAPAEHEHPFELEHGPLLDHLRRDPKLGRVDDRHAAAHPQPLVLAARVRRDVPLEVGRAAIALDVRAVRALPPVPRVCGGQRVRWVGSGGGDLDVATLAGDERAGVDRVDRCGGRGGRCGQTTAGGRRRGDVARKRLVKRERLRIIGRGWLEEGWGDARLQVWRLLAGHGRA